MTCTHTHTSPCHTCSRCIMRCISKHSSPGTASSVPPAGRFQCWQQSRRSCNTHPATKSRGTTGCLLKFCPTPSVLWAGRNKFPSLMVMQYYKISSNHSCRPLVSRLFCPLFRVEKCVYIYTHVCVHTIHVIINKYDQIGLSFAAHDAGQQCLLWRQTQLLLPVYHGLLHHIGFSTVIICNSIIARVASQIKLSHQIVILVYTCGAGPSPPKCAENAHSGLPRLSRNFRGIFPKNSIYAGCICVLLNSNSRTSFAST